MLQAFVAQIATAATFSAAWLEALRMGFALLERPDGSLASPFSGEASLALPVLAALVPAAAPAALAGGASWTTRPPPPFRPTVLPGANVELGSCS